MVAYHDHNPIRDFSTDGFLQALKLMAARRRQSQGKKKGEAIRKSLAAQSYALGPI